MSESKDVSLLCPTRKRPAELERMIRSAVKTAIGSIEILVYVDDDDPTRHLDIAPAIKFVGPSNGVGRAWNHLAMRATGARLMMANDDLVFETIGWDHELLSREPADRIYVAWFNDGSMKPERCAFPIVSRRWYEALGYFVPECFHFLWHDAWVWDVGRRLRRELPILSVLVEHHHFAFKKAEYDETYRRHRVGPDNQRKRREDEATFIAMAEQRQRDADLLRGLMDDSV